MCIFSGRVTANTNDAEAVCQLLDDFCRPYPGSHVLDDTKLDESCILRVLTLEMMDRAQDGPLDCVSALWNEFVLREHVLSAKST